MDDGDARLLDAGRGQRGRADDVARGVDVRDFALVVRVDRDEAALAGRDAGGGEVQVGGVALPAGADEHAVARERRARGKREDDVAGLRGIARGDALLPVKLHAVRRHRVGERARDFRVEKRHQRVAAIDQMHLDAERGERAGVFAADHAAADDDELLRHRRELEDFVGVVHAVVARRETPADAAARSRWR